ncbi:hypothetical protein [Limnovirga soli]|jgi:hypothetical protein|uniref:Uncharacterized protein n=1 Tax=Limnovirga soli TaxID=2656915 RepID=A0A8J8FIK2_9BACT|nr:hypothetical protein [Limnovirga soli]NNV56999.1 hypothetical protein [Limnovirga soli]
MNKIKHNLSDKVNGKLLKYRQGDCLSVNCKNGKYLGVLISNKFNKYYDLTVIDFYEPHKPGLTDFINGKFFGTRFGSWEELTYAVNVRMIECKYVDNCSEIEKVGSVKLISNFIKDGYAYLDDIEQLEQHYIEELPIRIEKSKNAEKFPDLAFVSKHFVDFRHIMQ